MEECWLVTAKDKDQANNAKIWMTMLVLCNLLIPSGNTVERYKIPRNRGRQQILPRGMT